MKKGLPVFLCLVVGLAFSCQQQPTVDSVVADMTIALGGAETLDGINDQVSKWDFTMHVLPPDMPEGTESPMSMPMTITYKTPDKLKFDMHGPDGSVMTAMSFDGEKVWHMEMGQLKDGTEAQTKESAAMIQTWLDGFRNAQDKGLTLEPMPNEIMDGTEYIVLKAIHENGVSNINYINAETNLMEKQVGEMTNFEGELEAMYMTFADYKMVDGINMAHYVAKHLEDGTMLWEGTMTECQYNTGVEDSFFMAKGEEISIK